MWQVVNVWENRPKEKKIVLKQPLYGHTETVTCLASSQNYNLIVSGSRDRTCIIWDLSRLVHVRQLRGHTAPVAAVCINELTVSTTFCLIKYTNTNLCYKFFQLKYELSEFTKGVDIQDILWFVKSFIFFFLNLKWCWKLLVMLSEFLSFLNKFVLGWYNSM